MIETENVVFLMKWKVVAELIGTYFVIFAGCGSVAVNKIYGGDVTFPGICVTWGLIVMVMIYTVGHVSGAHFNPAVTLTLALFRRFPWKEVLSLFPTPKRRRITFFRTLNCFFELLLFFWV